MWRCRSIAAHAGLQRTVRSSRACGDRIRQVSARHVLRSSSNGVYSFAPPPSSPRLGRRPRFTPMDGEDVTWGSRRALVTDMAHNFLRKRCTRTPRV